jgi:hypothetical protein
LTGQLDVLFCIGERFLETAILCGHFFLFGPKLAEDEFKTVLYLGDHGSLGA